MATTEQRGPQQLAISTTSAALQLSPPDANKLLGSNKLVKVSPRNLLEQESVGMPPRTMETAETILSTSHFALGETCGPK